MNSAPNFMKSNFYISRNYNKRPEVPNERKNQPTNQPTNKHAGSQYLLVEEIIRKHPESANFLQVVILSFFCRRSHFMPRLGLIILGRSGSPLSGAAKLHLFDRPHIPSPPNISIPSLWGLGLLNRQYIRNG